MHDLEQRTQQLVCDWQTLRQGLERAPQDQRLRQFYHTQLDVIDDSIITLQEIVHCIARCAAPSVDGESPVPFGQHASALHDWPLPAGPPAKGLGARLKRIRQAEDAGENLP